MESLKFVGANFCGLSIFLQVRGDAISRISWLERGGGGVVEKKDNSGNVYFTWNELSFFTMVT